MIIYIIISLIFIAIAVWIIGKLGDNPEISEAGGKATKKLFKYLAIIIVSTIAFFFITTELMRYFNYL